VLRALAAANSAGSALVLAELASAQWWLHVVEQVLAAIHLALALAGPMLAVAWATHIGFGLVARAASPVSFAPMLPALRAIVALLFFALLFQALAGALFEQLDGRLP
jgi:type III secretory pathway component EscT